MLPFLVTPCLVVAVQPCMEYIPIKTNTQTKKQPKCDVALFEVYLARLPLSQSVSHKTWEVKMINTADDSHNLLPLLRCTPIMSHFWGYF